MQEVYRINVQGSRTKDSYVTFTLDKNVFDTCAKFSEISELRYEFDPESLDEDAVYNFINGNEIYPDIPYVLMGETNLYNDY